MKTNKKTLLFLHIAESFFTSWALMKAARMESGNILTGVFFLLSFFLYRHIHERLAQADFSADSPAARRTSCILSVIFTLLYMAVDYNHYIEKLTSRLFRTGILVSVFIGFFLLFYKLLMLLFSHTGDKARLQELLFIKESGAASSKKTGFIKSIPGFYQKHPGLCGFFLCLLGWLPYFLYQYPGIMTPDSINQFEQVLGIIPYSNHHPWVHTLLIKLFYSIGSLFSSNMVVALSFYTVFQMCGLAFSVSYFINTLTLYRIKPGICLAVTLFYALVPYHGVFSVTLWKDILFAAAVLVFGCSLLRLQLNFKPYSIFMFVLSGIMLCLFRSNGWYGFLICVPFLAFYYRKRAGVMLPALGAVLLTAILVKYPLMNAYSVAQPDFVESVAIPSQQIAAVLCHDRPLTKEQLALIENTVDLTYIKDLYNPTYADNIKELIRAGHPEYLSAHKGEFFRLWLTLGAAYPADYLNAYIYQTYGYWYPDSFYLVAEAEGVSGTKLGVSHTPLIRGPLVIKAKEIAVKLGSMLPIYSLLWSMGIIFWCMLFCMGNAFVRKEKYKLIFYLPSAALFLTVMIATPVATEFRYVYFMVFSLPFYLLTALLPMPKETKSTALVQ